MTAKTFRKKPVEIQAVQWDGTAEGATPIINWIDENGHTANWDEPHDEILVEMPDGTQMGCPASDGGLFINTLEGCLTASPGDWIIRGVQGEFYPCKPDIFAQTYDEPDTSTSIDSYTDQIVLDSKGIAVGGIRVPGCIVADPRTVIITKTEREDHWTVAITLMSSKQPVLEDGVQATSILTTDNRTMYVVPPSAFPIEPTDEV